MFAIFALVTALSAILLFSTALLAILAAVIALFAIFALVIELSIILSALTESLANLSIVTALAAILPTVIELSIILSALTELLANLSIVTALPAILPTVTAFDAILSSVTALSSILGGVIALSAILAEVTLLSAIFGVVTLLSAIFDVVILLSTILTVVIDEFKSFLPSSVLSVINFATELDISTDDIFLFVPLLSIKGSVTSTIGNTSLASKVFLEFRLVILLIYLINNIIYPCTVISCLLFCSNIAIPFSYNRGKLLLGGIAG